MTFSADSDDYTNDVYPPGEYEITIKGTASESGAEVPTKITIVIKDPCYPPESITPPGFVDVSYVLTVIVPDYVTKDFTIAPGYCKFNTQYTISDFSPDTLPNAVMKGSADLAWSFFYDQDLLILDQTQTTEVTATSYTDKTQFNNGAVEAALVMSDAFDTTFDNPCNYEFFTTLTVTTQSPITFTDDYSGMKQIFTYVPFIVSPDICPLTVSCTEISSEEGPTTLLTTDYELDESNAVDLIFNTDDYSSGKIAPFAYTFTYSVTTGSPDASLTKNFSFDVTLADPCSTSVITTPTFSD